WRQPLSVISSASTGILMQREFGLSTNEKENEALTTINNSAQFLSQTISDFKDFFNTNKNKESFNIKDIYLKTLGIIKSKFEKDDIEIIEKLDSIDMVGLKGELTQVFINILNNARDILITKSDQKLFIFVDIYKDKNNVIVEIKDNAGGIAPDILNKVFEPYFTTKHKAQGTGIGLYMCQNILVKNMNGELSVENEKYRYEGINYTGANFKIIIPQDNIGN
ncbi:MAG: HAMP domain-containing histidine kinase, partial [Arcobacteraceae bacterium]|nr:HAMP domain-containing histidine kinase [Arcobacteraceae bacterium]